MKNLHLKNLNNNDPFEFYVKNTIKQIETYQNKIKKLQNKTLTYLLYELQNIKIINSTISEFRNDIIENTKANINLKFTNYDLYELIALIHNFKKIKDIDLNTIIDIENCGYDYDEVATEENTTIYEITPIYYDKINEPFKNDIRHIRRYLDITIQDNKVIYININN